MRSSIFHFAIINIKIRFQNTYLGLSWAAIEPLLYFVVLYVVFTSIRDREEDFAIYLISGIMFFHIFTRGTSTGLGSLKTNGSILQSLKIKKELFPLTAVVATGILGIVDVAVFFALMPVFQFVPTWTIILIPIPLALLLLLILGLSYFLSVANVFARDVQHLWSIFAHTLLFTSPIFWQIQSAKEILLYIHSINPLGQLIEINHKLVINGEIPPLNDWLYATLLVLIIFFAGYAFFHKFENRIVEEL